MVDVETIRRAAASEIHTIAINGTYRAAPFADVLYACDATWWDANAGAADYMGQKWTQVEGPSDRKKVDRWGLNWVRGRDRAGLSLDPELIHYGGNSGFQAINLAVLMGARRIILTGYDMKPGADGRKHWHDREPNRGGWPVWQRWIDRLGSIAPSLTAAGVDVEIFNATRETAIPDRVFPRRPLESLL